MTVKAVVFDFDGVIANSEPLHFRGYKDVLSAIGVDLAEADYYARYLGFDDEGAFQAIAADKGISWSSEMIAGLIERKAVRLEELERGGSVLFPGAAAAIERLASACPLAIASGALGAEIVRVLEHERLSRYFVTVVSADDTPVSKPAPDPYLCAVTRLATATGGALEAAECVAIEDSAWGLQSARAAGLRTIGIAHTYPADRLKDADAVITHLDQLTWDFVVGLRSRAI